MPPGSVTFVTQEGLDAATLTIRQAADREQKRVNTNIASLTKLVMDGQGALQFEVVGLKNIVRQLTDRVTALEGTKPPVEPPDEPPPTTGPSFFQKKLLGGFRLEGEFARGEIAISPDGKTMALVGHAQRNDVYIYDVPATLGDPLNMATWPIVKPKQIIAGWWPSGDGYANSLRYDENGDLWCAGRVFYDTSPPSITKIFKLGGTEPVTINVPRQQFSGFVTAKEKNWWLLGGGGYESGQGSAFGPTVYDQNTGKVLIGYDFTNTWEKRCPREPNYFPEDRPEDLNDGVDSWVALKPRVVNGKLEGRWACDRLYGGGIKLDDGFYFFAHMAIGAVAYRVQTSNFDVDGVCATYVYRFNDKGELLEWTLFDAVGSNPVFGQDVGSDGKIYLSEGNAWKSGLYKVDCAIRVYG